MKANFILFLHILSCNECNLLRSPEFSHPVIPSRILFYTVEPEIYVDTYWRFGYPALYVPYSFPLPMAEHPENHHQALFVSEDSLLVFQPLVLNMEFPAVFKVTVKFRMPYMRTEGNVGILLDEEFALTLTFEQSGYNEMVYRTEFITVQSKPENLMILAFNFNRNNHEMANGYQIFKVILERSTAEELWWHEHPTRKRLKRKREHKYTGYSPILKRKKYHHYECVETSNELCKRSFV